MYRITLILTYISVILSCPALGQADGGIVTYLDAPGQVDKDIQQQIQYESPFSFSAHVGLSCRMIRKVDTLDLYSLQFDRVVFLQGAHSQMLNFSKAKEPRKIQKSFSEVILKFNTLPPGKYIVALNIDCRDSGVSFSKQFYWDVDSLLPFNSKIRSDINTSLYDIDFKPQKGKQSIVMQSKALQRKLTKIKRGAAKKNGINTINETISGADHIAIYFKDIFLGRYLLEKSDKDVQQSIIAENKMLKSDPSSLIKNNFDDFSSVSDQVRKLNVKLRKDNEVTGVIDLNSSFSGDQEQSSEQENNYVELAGQIETKVFDMPIVIEGFYTTQDQHRNAKASFFRFHYDVDKAKAGLLDVINGYKNKYNEISTKGKGMDQVLSTYSSNLAGEKSRLLTTIGKEYGLDGQLLDQYHGDVDQLIASANSSNIGINDSLKAKNISRFSNIKQNKDQIQKRYQQVSALNEKLERYKQLQSQFKAKTYLDSAINYDNVRELSNTDDISYKKMTKMASGILPGEKKKSFFSGLTHLDVGIISRTESAYTLSGQNMKCFSLGYDLGAVQVSGTAGKMDYVSRDGNVDVYNSYSVKGDCKVTKGNNVSLIYYNYSPTRQILNDNFFKDIDVAYPTFKKPTHITSLVYEGILSKRVIVNVEAANSFRNDGGQPFLSKDNIALKSSVDFLVPATSVVLNGEWEYLAKNFDNNVLPYTKAATERYSLNASSDFYRSFFTVGVQYSLLKQLTFNSSGYSRKWGFDLKTHFKGLPNAFISYKPFSTFRTYSDTSVIQQRPLIGEVWVARLSYQIKRKLYSYRFAVIFNQNNSIIDTASYHTKNFQASCNYIRSKHTASVNSGWLRLPESDMNGYVKNDNYFFNFSVGTELLHSLSMTVGQDFGWAEFGFQRSTTNVGILYSFRKLPISVRLNGRYTSYKQTEIEGFKEIYAGRIGVQWKIRTRKSG
jgi:hypothetical protein